jgi:hypothetical protein
MIRGAGVRTTAYLFGAALAIASLAACRDEGTGGNLPNNPNNPNNPTFTCPGEGVTVCDLKYESSPEHPAISDPVQLTGVLVTSSLFAVSTSSSGVVTLNGFFVQDQETLQGEYSGILVLSSPFAQPPLTAPELGDIVNLTGTFEEFGRDGFDAQKQLVAITVEVTGRAAVEPLVVDSAQVLAEKSKSYEGVLVRLNEVSVTGGEFMHPSGQTIFGSFQVENTVVVSNALFRYRTVAVGEVLTSLTGIMRVGTAPFDAGTYMLSPRSQLDVVLKNASSVVTSIRDLQDTTASGHPSEKCANLTGGETIGKCAVAKLSNVVVTAVDGYVSRNLRAIYLQDDTVADGRFAGVKVVYNPNSIDVLPEVGMRVDLEAELIEYRATTQLQYPTFTVLGPRVTPQPVTVSSNDLNRTSGSSNPFEGGFVKILGAEVTSACQADEEWDHGNWVVDSVVYLGNGFDYSYNGQLRSMCSDQAGDPTGNCACSVPVAGDQRSVGDVFESITGVVDNAFDNLTLQPRSDADLVLQ